MTRRGGALGCTGCTASQYIIYTCAQPRRLLHGVVWRELWSADRHPNATATTICLALPISSPPPARCSCPDKHAQSPLRASGNQSSLPPSPSPSALSRLLARAGFRWLLVDAWEAHWQLARNSHLPSRRCLSPVSQSGPVKGPRHPLCALKPAASSARLHSSVGCRILRATLSCSLGALIILIHS
jgi:hypothetical protein